MRDLGAKKNHHDLICLSHLRWAFVFQRPQHLMTRFARTRRVFFFEEPVFDGSQSELRIRRDQGVVICVPHLATGLTSEQVASEVRRLLNELHRTYHIERPVVWYYTPMALDYARHLSTSAIVFDCMDELAAFKIAPPQLVSNEAELLGRADLVFTGGQSLYEAKRGRSRRVFAFPSSVDVPHFAAAKSIKEDPPDQADVPHPRLGFFGVIDERMDLNLLRAIATARPDWHLVILGPCVKIDPATLPRGHNIHYLGMKTYAELPSYLAGWDVALLPFARNESTRFISPTKTPEYLAAGCPVVSTSVRDVVSPYADRGLVSIADAPEEFIIAVEQALAGPSLKQREEIDQFLSQLSWERTWSEMASLLEGVASSAQPVRAQTHVPDHQTSLPVGVLHV